MNLDDSTRQRSKDSVEQSQEAGHGKPRPAQPSGRKAKRSTTGGRGGSTDRESDGFGGRAPTGPSGRKTPSGTPPARKAGNKRGGRKPRPGSDSNKERRD